MIIKVKKLSEDAQLPTYAEEGSVGADLYSVEDVVVRASGRRLSRQIISTGLVFDPEDFVDIQVRPRSGLAAKYGITVLNSPGTIDPSYRGEIRVILINHGSEDFKISKGDRIAQIVCNPLRPTFELTEEVSTTLRGSGGFGSTGR